MKTVLRGTTAFAAAAVLVLCLCGQKSGVRSFGKVSSITGTAELRREESERWRPLTAGATLLWGDSVRTGAESDLEITFGGNTVRLGEKTTIGVGDTVDSVGQTTITVMNVGGEVLSDIRNLGRSAEHYNVVTPTAVAAVRGTHFLVVFTPGVAVTHVNVLDGRVWVHNPLLLAPPVVLLPGFFTAVAFRALPHGPKPIPYGQFKKMARVLGPKGYKKYTRKFKIKPGMGIHAPIVPGKAKQIMKGKPGPRILKQGPGAKVLPKAGGRLPGAKGPQAKPSRPSGKQAGLKGGQPVKSNEKKGGGGKGKGKGKK
jgi:hypothetical protein